MITDGDVILTEALNNMLSNEETIHFFYPLIYDAHCCEIGPLGKFKFCSGLDEKFVPETAGFIAVVSQCGTISV